MMMNFDFANIDVNASVGKKIQKKRKELGYTGMQLAKKLVSASNSFLAMNEV